MIQSRTYSIIKPAMFILAVLFALGLTGAAFGQPAPSLFELERNANAITDHVGPGAPDDWDRLNTLRAGFIPPNPGPSHADLHVYVIDAVIGNKDSSIFQTGGSKDVNDINTITGIDTTHNWMWTVGSILDKDDLLHGYAALYKVGDSTYLFFGSDRFANNGDAQIGFWFFKNKITLNPGGYFNGVHAIGDVLLLSDFTGGGGTATIRLFRWVGPPDADNLEEIAPLPATDAFAAVCSTAQVSPWEFIPKNAPVDTFQHGMFYEGGVNLTKLLGSDICFSTMIAETRSAQSLDAQLKDFILHSFPTVPEVSVNPDTVCIGSAGELCPTITGGIGPFTYSWTGPSGFISSDSCIHPTIAGNYILSVTGANNCTGIDTTTFTVAPKPVLSATGDELTCDSTNASTDLTSTPSVGITIVWSGTGLVSGGNTLHARWSQPGFKKAVVTINATGCKDSTTAVITQDITKPVLSATGDELTCDSLLASACVSSTPNVGVSYLWTPAPVSGQGNACVRYDAPGTKKVVVTILATGCKDSTTAEITQNVTKPILSCTTDTLTCDSTNASTTVTSDPSVGIAIVWSGDGLVSGGNTTHARWSEPGVKKALVTIDATGCKDSCTAEVFPDTAKPTCTVSPTDTTICQGTNATFCINPSGGKPPYIYLWEGPNGYTSAESCITVSDSGTYTVTVKGTNGCADTCLAILRVETCGQEYCGLTQGAYGNYNGEHFGKRTLALIQSLLADSALVVGKPGRSITIDSAAAECIIKRLPGGTKPDTLPAIGDDTLSWDRCQTSPPIPLMLNGNDPGRFANVLLAQTITLSLNLRVSTCDLGSFELCDEIQTKKAVFGDDGLPCTDDDMIKPGSDSISVKIPSSVSTALSNLGLSNDVNGLLELANRALAGWPRGGASLSQINNAVDAINRGFDECRFVTYCGPLVPVLSLYKEAVSMPTEFSLSQSYPNPFNPVCVIAYALPTDCQVRLVVYNLLGQRVKVLVDELQNAGYKSVTWDGKDGQGQELASGIYFYRIEAGSFVQSKKMMLMK